MWTRRGIVALQAGTLPFYEPGLEPLLRRGLASGRLRFTTSYRGGGGFRGRALHVRGHAAAARAPARADLASWTACVRRAGPAADRRPCLVVGKSTGPAWHGGRATPAARPDAPAGQAWNWRGTRSSSGRATRWRHAAAGPDRGRVCGRDRAEALLRAVYAEPLAAGVPLLVTDLATAELVKVAANAFLATKISFINAMAEVCEVTGADVAQPGRARSAATRGSARPGCAPASASAAAACPRTSGPWRPAPRELGAGRGAGLPARDRRDQREAPGPLVGPRRRTGRRGLLAGAGSGCSAPRSRRARTTSRDSPALHMARTCATGGPRSPCTTRRPLERAAAGASGTRLCGVHPGRGGRRRRAAGADRVAGVRGGRPGRDRRGGGQPQGPGRPAGCWTRRAGAAPGGSTGRWAARRPAAPRAGRSRPRRPRVRGPLTPPGMALSCCRCPGRCPRRPRPSWADAVRPP